MSTQLSSSALPGHAEIPAGSVRDAPRAPALGVTNVSDLPGANQNGALQPAPPTRLPSSRLSRSNTAQQPKDKEAKPPFKAPSATPPSNVGLDTLSTQIYLRSNSNTEPTIAQRLLHPNRPESPTTDGLGRPSADGQGRSPSIGVEASRDRRKGSSFLSRLAIRGSWRKDDAMLDSDSEMGEVRTDGSNARVLTSVIGAGGGFIPLHKEPPRYIRVKAHYKKSRDFDRLFLAQELLGARRASEDAPRSREPATAVGSKLLKSGDAIWAAEFSLDGRNLAVAGKDQTVRVFSVIATPEDRKAYEEEDEGRGPTEGERLSAPVFRPKPTREFAGHTGEVLALSWSKNNFLLSTSMDKTVKLWHMSRAECLCTFKHNDLVTSIAFHPTDDRFFLAGSLDSQLRLWSIPDKAVAFSATANDFVTAVAFTPDGKTAICGLLNGLCLFFDTEGLTLQSQIHVRSSRGKNAKGSKITGIETAILPSEGGSREVKVLISSNDSRVRIYSLRTKMLEAKFRGLENSSSQIHARFSDDGAYVISGSEDRRAYIWNITNLENDFKDKQPYECFDAHPEVVTTASIAPTKTRQLLSASGDPLYDLCNPPPVKLVSLEEENASQTKLSEEGRTGSVAGIRKPEESPAYIERSKHVDGNIIVTTDRTGIIKVFRQDCAYVKRQQSAWETSSRFSGRLTGVGRSASIATRTSTSSRVHSRRGSLNLGAGQNQAQPTSDRIMSWRQDVEGRPSMSLVASRSERSLSPMKASGRLPLNSSAASLALEARRKPYTASMASRTNHVSAVSPTSSIYTGQSSLRAQPDKENGTKIPPTPSFSLISASSSDQNNEEGAESSFWNLSRWKPSLPVLRYSQNASSSAVAGTDAANPKNEHNGIDRDKSGDRTSRRRSLANDIQRLTAGEVMDRRQSTSSTLLSTAPSNDLEKGAGATDKSRPMRGDKRADSGVAEISAGSTDGNTP